MNEQIRTILAEDGTKTSKIRKLLLLGLTHREIADLVTRGNRGFVWNVYKRMRDEGLIVSAGTPTATTTPELDYSFRRKFGVEIEAYNCTCQRLVRELTEAGIEVASERYNHDLRPHWKLVTDSSLNGNDTFELVSPILEGEDGLEKLERVCWVLDSCNVKINGSCGLHVHMNAEDFNITTWRNLLLSYKHAEAEIDKFMPASRRGGSNTYCGSLIQFPTPQDGRVPPAFGNHQFYKNRKLGVFSRQNDYLCIRGFSACRNQTGRFSFPGRETKVVL